MKKYSLFASLVLSASIGYAQFPKIDHKFEEKIVEQKTRYYKRMMLCEQQKTANQEDYDVKYYALDLTPDPTTSILSGAVQVVGEVVSPTLDHVELNFWDGMSITDVHCPNSPNVPLNYQRSNDILSVDLDKTYLQGEKFDLMVAYNGRPQNSDISYFGTASFHFDTYNGNPMIWTLSEPFGARAWWPCKDVPSDKADSVDIRVTVPGYMIVASNGTLRETVPIGGKTMYWWHEKYPIVTYLVSLAIHPYEVHYDDYLYNDGADTMKIHFYTFSGNYNQYSAINSRVKDMIACFSQLFGEYPFVEEKYGHADCLWGGGMEHQTCTSFGIWNEPTYAHELAHQWWGDMITCDSFHHIWLNEGFATYSQALWYEHAYPPYTSSEYQMANSLYFGPGTVYVENPENEAIFDRELSYRKASWVLHMLRHVVGDNTFFYILRTYYASPACRHGTATTEEFQAICEQVSGMDLEKFFHQWIYEEYFPRYSFSWTWVQNGSEYDIELELRQTQTNALFWMPVDVTVSTASGETTFVVWDSLQTQSFQLSVSSKPMDLEIDKNNWILKQIPDSIINPTFDQGILLVNGVSFNDYGTVIWNAYQSRAFWGDFPISFWDCFDAPPGGYPSTLPEPLGHGKVPGDILGRFSTVIWVGNNYGGDLTVWRQTSILPYLEAGGNLILMTKEGQSFLNDEMQQYLGITWTENPLSTIQNCISTYPGLTNMAMTMDQTRNAVFDTSLTSNESMLLFKETASFGVPRGLGVWRKPAEGGTDRSDGGQFVFISGRPFYYNSNQLRANIEFILENFLQESTDVDGTSRDVSIHKYTLEQNYPNPFNPATSIEYDLPKHGHVRLTIYDVLGRHIRTLVETRQQAGHFQTSWDGKNERNLPVTSGLYFCRMEAGEFVKVIKLALMR